MMIATTLKKLSVSAAGAVATIGVLASASQAASLGVYTFEGNQLTPSSVVPNITLSNFSYTGLGTINFYNDNTKGDAYAANKWSRNDNLGNYFSFTVIPNAGYQMTLNSILLDERRSSTGIRNWQIRSSLDNFVSSINTFTVPDNENWRQNQTTTLGTAFTNMSSAVTFRLYGYNAEGNRGTWRVDDVRVSGSVGMASVQSVPEPATILGLVAVASLGVTLKRKQQQKA